MTCHGKEEHITDCHLNGPKPIKKSLLEILKTRKDRLDDLNKDNLDLIIEKFNC